jgi:ketosteroid isomerase-like protein
MSKELAQLVEKGYEAWNAGDRGWVLDHMSEDVEWITPEDDPDPSTYHGYRGVEEYWAQWRAAVGQLRFAVEEMIDAGDNVVVVARRQGRGEHSGLEISDRVIQVFHFEGINAPGSTSTTTATRRSAPCGANALPSRWISRRRSHIE